MLCGIHLRAIYLIPNMFRAITLLKLLLHLPGANELNVSSK